MIEDSALRALILSFMAGMSTLLGALIIFVTNKKSEKLVTISLGFAGGVMISVSFTDLLPNANVLLTQYGGYRFGIVAEVLLLLTGVMNSSSFRQICSPMSQRKREMEKNTKIFSV